jgi:CubicO group peptidase (beta-lactamase class C family)
VSISADDRAHIGQLLLDGGAHDGRQLVAKGWIERMTRPCEIAPFYGRLLWLNRSGLAFPGASKRAAFMVGAGGHYVGVDP